MKKIKLLVLTAALLYLPMDFQSYNIFYDPFDANAQNITWGIFKREKEEDNKIDSKIRGILQEM